MNQTQIKEMLSYLRAQPAENEWLEFKTAKNSYEFDDLGKYFSALSNEANLQGIEAGWLVLGVVDKDRKIVGTKFKEGASLQDLKLDIANHTNGRITFKGIHEYRAPEGRVLLFEIPPCVHGIPTTWKDVAYGREGESLKPLSMHEMDTIRAQAARDWSGEAANNASIHSLDDEAVLFLRKKLADVYKDDKYLKTPLENLLNGLSLLRNGVPNNTAMLFLGKQEVVEALLPEIGQISWRYTDERNDILERLQLKSPLLPKLYDLQDNIHRFNTYLRDYDLFRTDIRQYDDDAIQELLVNSLAHRDWTIPLWVEVIQTPSSVAFRNPGIFRASLLEALERNLRPPYSNRAMAEFFQKIRLMEKEGGGLRRVYQSQLKKGTRIVPDFAEKSDPPRVEFALMGKVENVSFAKLVLSADDEISLSDLLLLDKIASGSNAVGKDIDAQDASRLRERDYIEIRGSRFRKAYISETLSHAIGRKGAYIREKGLPREKKIEYILNFLDKYHKMQMTDVYQMFPEDKQNTLRYLISREMTANRGLLKRVKPSGRASEWYYVKS